MMSILVYLSIILFLGFSIASVLRKKIVEVLPITIALVISIIFVFGLLGALILGIVFTFLFSVGLAIYTLIIQKKRRYSFHIFSSLIFLALVVVDAFLIKGKLFDRGDEFSHWGDVVRATVDINGFSTNPGSMSAFQSYPPGMVIFQYMLQRIHILLGGSFSEWRCYFSYNLFLLCFMMPAISKLSYKKPLYAIVSVASILLLPSVFYQTTYYSLYIDVVVSCVFGFGLYIIVKNEDNEKYKLCSVCATCFVLPLLKDVGLFFSVILLVDYFICMNDRKKTWMIIISIVVPTLLWKTNVKITNASEVFPFRYDLNELWRVINGTGENYKQVVLNEFPKYFITQKFKIGDTSIEVSYFTLMIIISVCSCFVLQCYCKDQNQVIKRMSYSVIPFSLILYTIGMYLSYMFQFSEYEAIRFASYQRYMNIPICGICLFMLFLCSELKTRGIIYFILCLMVFISPIGNVYKLIDGEIVSKSYESRQKYNELATLVQQNTNGDSTVYIISQQDNGGDFWIFHYLFRPNKVIIGQLSNRTGFEAGGYSIGKPYYEGDIWSSDVTPGELMDEWVARYDYVAIYRTNDYLDENYSMLFDTEITNNCLYLIDKENRIARLVQ